MRIVQEEIFGPVLVVQTFDDEAKAIHLANDTVYSLAGAVFTQDVGEGASRDPQTARRHHLDQYLSPNLQRGSLGRLQASPGSAASSGTYGYEAYTGKSSRSM